MPFGAPIIILSFFFLCVNLVKCIDYGNDNLIQYGFLCPNLHFCVVNKNYVSIFSIANDKELDGGELILAWCRDVLLNKEILWICLL